MSDYPKYMCKAGGSEEVWGKLVTSGQAEDEAHEEQLLEDGWVYSPADLDTPTEVEVAARARKGKAAEVLQGYA